MFSSIKAKIIIFYMITLFVILSALGVFLYFSLGKIVYNSIDFSLLLRAKSLATLINIKDNKTEFNFSDEVIWKYNSPRSKSFFQIRRLNGNTLEKSASLGISELPFSAKKNQTNFRTIILNGEHTRLINFYVSGINRYNKEKNSIVKNKGHALVIQCAENIEDKIDLLQSYGIVLSLSILFIMVISASGGFLIAKKALAPLKKISETIDRISESNLTERIDHKTIPDELSDLASSFNRTFDRLERSFNRQNQFIADASHELRTPLSVILSQSEIALRKERSSEDYRSALNAVMDAEGMMSEIVSKLLALTRLSEDKMNLRFENIDLHKIISKSIKLLNPLAEQKGIRINISTNDHYRTTGDRAALLALFVNIFENSIKYNVPQGRIDIFVKKETDFIVTEIRDTGIGIPESDLDKVFDRFYRVDKSRSKESGGTGLGLSICKEITKLHGGKVEIKSRVGVGTIVAVYLKEKENEKTVK
ncbi:MAG: sensor histidine kinase [bacterium]